MKPKDELGSGSLGSEIKADVKREVGTWFKWAAAGAMVGAVLLGGLGAYLLGSQGLLWGAGSGAVMGGLGSWLFYLNATTL